MHQLHVIVDQASPDGTELWTLRISAIALLVAVATFGAVLYQIYIARRELEAVKQDLENNNQQMAELRRRPKLRLAGSATLRANLPATIDFTLYVRNLGNRVSEWAMLFSVGARSPLLAERHRRRAYA